MTPVGGAVPGEASRRALFEGPRPEELFSLSGRTALVTGGAKGLGFSIAVAFAQVGATVVLAGRSEGSCVDAAASLAEVTGARCVGLQLDVTNEGSVQAMCGRVLEELGRIDVLVNSAGVNARSLIADCPVEDFDKVLEVNLRGTWLCCREVGRAMLEAGRGSVVNIGSALGAVGLARRTPYCASKAGVLGLTQAAALEWAGSGVRCNALCPGPFLTDLNRPLLDAPGQGREVFGRTALNRWAELHEIRGPALFLASDASSYVTGAALYVDGGWTAQ